MDQSWGQVPPLIMMMWFMGDLRDVRPGGQADANPRARSRPTVVLQQTFSHVTGRHPNDCIGPGIVGGGPPKYFYSNDAFFQRVKASGDRFVNDVFEKLTTAVASSKRIAFKHFFEMILEERDLFRTDDVPNFFGTCIVWGRGLHTKINVPSLALGYSKGAHSFGAVSTKPSI